MRTGMKIAKSRSVVMLRELLVYESAFSVFAPQHVPVTVGSHCTARFVH